MSKLDDIRCMWYGLVMCGGTVGLMWGRFVARRLWDLSLSCDGRLVRRVLRMVDGLICRRLFTTRLGWLRVGLVRWLEVWSYGAELWVVCIGPLLDVGTCRMNKVVVGRRGPRRGSGLGDRGRVLKWGRCMI